MVCCFNIFKNLFIEILFFLTKKGFFFISITNFLSKVCATNGSYFTFSNNIGLPEFELKLEKHSKYF